MLYMTIYFKPDVCEICTVFFPFLLLLKYTILLRTETLTSR